MNDAAAAKLTIPARDRWSTQLFLFLDRNPGPLFCWVLSFSQLSWQRWRGDRRPPIAAAKMEAMANPKSTAQIAGHPIHPMLIPFPIAFFVSTFVADLIFWQTRSEAWANATLWLLGAGLVMAALAALAGLTDVLGDEKIRNLSAAWLHAGGNVVVVLIELFNWYLRYRQGSVAIVPTGLTLSLVVVLILLFTGWKGWEMVYRHRVGVTDNLPDR